MALQKATYLDKGMICALNVLIFDQLNPLVEIEVTLNVDSKVVHGIRLGNIFLRHLTFNTVSGHFRSTDAGVHFDFDNGYINIVSGMVAKNNRMLYIRGPIQSIMGADCIVAGEMIRDIVKRSDSLYTDVQNRFINIVEKSQGTVYYVGVHNWTYSDNVAFNYAAHNVGAKGTVTDSGAIIYNRDSLVIMPSVLYEVYPDMQTAICQFDKYVDRMVPRRFTVSMEQIEQFLDVMQCMRYDSLWCGQFAGVCIDMTHISDSMSVQEVCHIIPMMKSKLLQWYDRIDIMLMLSYRQIVEQTDLETVVSLQGVHDYQSVMNVQLYDSIGVMSIASDYISNISYSVIRGK